VIGDGDEGKQKAAKSRGRGMVNAREKQIYSGVGGEAAPCPIGGR
jgi:hypothetical protein